MVKHLLIILLSVWSASLAEPPPMPPMPDAVVKSALVRTNRIAYDRPAWLAWSPSISPGVVGYNLYYGTNVGAYTTEIPVGPVTNCEVTNLLRGWRYWFACASVNSQGIQSALSEPTSFIGFQTTPWMFVWDQAGLVESNLCEGTSFFKVDALATWSSPDMCDWSMFCEPGTIQFSNVVTIIP